MSEEELADNSASEEKPEAVSISRSKWRYGGKGRMKIPLSKAKVSGDSPDPLDMHEIQKSIVSAKVDHLPFSSPQPPQRQPENMNPSKIQSFRRVANLKPIEEAGKFPNILTQNHDQPYSSERKFSPNRSQDDIEIVDHNRESKSLLPDLPPPRYIFFIL